MTYYRLGAFWHPDKIVDNLTMRAGLNTADATSFELYVRTFCHNLLTDGILNYQSPFASSMIHMKVGQIITHNVLGINLFVKAINDIIDYQNSGDEHQEVKYNPIDNDNLTANLTKEDMVEHHTLKSLADAIKTCPDIEKVLTGIYNELSHMCIPCFTADIIANISTLDLTDWLTTTTVHVSQDTPENVITALVGANPTLFNISSLIKDYLLLSDNHVLSLDWEPWWELTPTVITVIIWHE